VTDLQKFGQKSRAVQGRKISHTIKRIKPEKKQGVNYGEKQAQTQGIGPRERDEPGEGKCQKWEIEEETLDLNFKGTGRAQPSITAEQQV